MFSFQISTLLPSMIILCQSAKNYYFPFVEFDEVPQNLLAVVNLSSERQQIYLSVVQQGVKTCSFFFLAVPPDLWDLSSPTRDGTRAALQWKRGVLTTGLPRNSRMQLILIFKLRY